MSTCITGFAHTAFSRWENEDVESLLGMVINPALEDAGVEASDVDAVYLSHFNGGFSDQAFTSSLVMQNSPALRFKPVTRVENACASGSAAVHAAVRAVESGKARCVLVAGVEKMTHAKNAGELLARACYLKEESRFGSFVDVFAQITKKYFETWGDHSEALALIAQKNHENGMKNPLAQLRKPFTTDFCLTVSDKNPVISGELKLSDCSPVSDGAAALVVCSEDFAASRQRKVRIAGISQVNDYLPMSKRDMSRLEGCALAWQQVFAASGLSLADLDLVETHDCFTTAELMQYEAMGLTDYGQGATAIREGWTRHDGKLPMNLSGGLKSKGHPIGATGVSMHIMAARQLLNEADDMQKANARTAGIFNMGGSGVANYCSILQRME